MRIYSATIPHDKQRYDTVGDYYPDPVDPRELVVRISAMKDWRSEAAVLIHELVEYFLCTRARVKIAAIDAWDLDHADAAEPGDVPDCPYGKQHRFAENIERLLVAELGMTWQQHEENVDGATLGTRPGKPAGANGGVRGGGHGVAAKPGGLVRDEPGPATVDAP